jgi:hypothetical protein
MLGGTPVRDAACQKTEQEREEDTCFLFSTLCHTTIEKTIVNNKIG